MVGGWFDLCFATPAWWRYLGMVGTPLEQELKLTSLELCWRLWQSKESEL